LIPKLRDQKLKLKADPRLQETSSSSAATAASGLITSNKKILDEKI
jgi:hypothetical protein